MTNEELKEFKSMFGKYCRSQINKGHCEGDTCEFCPIQRAYEDIENFEKMDAKITVRIYGIGWDTDGEEVDLPSEVIHTFEGYNDITDDDFVEEISEWLSDEYGFCHTGFAIEEKKENK